MSPRLVFGAPLLATRGTDIGASHIPVALTVVFAVVVFAIVAVGLVVALIQRSRRTSPPPDSEPGDGHGWGGRPRRPRPDSPGGPRGGIPLDDAVPARVRLRSGEKLADLLPRRVRRPAREPDRRPVRERTPS